MTSLLMLFEHATRPDFSLEVKNVDCDLFFIWNKKEGGNKIFLKICMSPNGIIIDFY